MKARGVLVVVLVLSPLGATAQIDPVGAEFQVNSYTTSSQFVPRSAAGSGGTFVTVWESFDQDGDASGVFGQRLDGAGRLIGSEFQVNTYTVGYQRFPAIAAGVDGAFVVAWQGDQDGDAPGVFGQRYDSTGRAAGVEFQVSAYTIGNQRAPTVVAATGGNFTLAWTSDRDGSGYGLLARRYDGAGQPLGTEFQVNGSTIGNQRLPVASAGSDGSFVVAWQSYRDGDFSDVFARRFDGAGQPVDREFQVNTYTTGYQFGAAVTVDARGSFVVAWESYRDGDYSGVFGQRFDSTGLAAGTEFQVNTHTADYQLSPALVTAADGSFMVTWQSLDQDGGGYGVFGQRYDSAGQHAGAEFQINSHTVAYQRFSTMAASADGSFIVAWQSLDQDGDIDGVFAQRFLGPTSAPTSTPTSTDTPDPFATPTNTPSASATPTATAPPTLTASRTPTRTSIPSSTASFTVEPTPSATATRLAVGCTGDCDGDGRVSVDELIAAVGIALGQRSIGDCAALDLDESETITIEELVVAVRASLKACITERSP